MAPQLDHPHLGVLARPFSNASSGVHRKGAAVVIVRHPTRAEVELALLIDFEELLDIEVSVDRHLLVCRLGRGQVRLLR